MTRLDHPLKAIFDPKTLYGSRGYTAQIGTIKPQVRAIGSATETDTAGAIGAVLTPPVCDDFNRADSVNLGSNWANNSNGAIVSNQLKITNDDWINWAASVGNDCYAQADIVSGLSGNIMGVFARWTTDSDFYIFRLAANSGSHLYQLYRRQSGTYTLLDQLNEVFPSTPIGIRITAVGTALAGQIWDGSSWVTKVAAVDSVFPTGGRTGVFYQRLVASDGVFDSFCTGSLPSDAPQLANAVHWWDWNTTLGSTAVSDRINAAHMSAVGGSATRVALGGQGLQAARCNPAGAAALRFLASGGSLPTGAQWASWIGNLPNVGGSAGVYFILSSAANASTAANFLSGVVCYTSVQLNSGSNDANTHIFYAEFNGASGKIYVDGVLAASGNMGASASSDGNMSMFNSWAGGIGGNIVIGELAVGSGTNTGTAITNEYNRLNAKWI